MPIVCSKLKALLQIKTVKAAYFHLRYSHSLKENSTEKIMPNGIKSTWN